MNSLRVAIAGSTAHTVQCAQALQDTSTFEISWILTSSPKPQGRKQLITPNPLHQFGEKEQIPVVLLEHNIDFTIQKKLEALHKTQAIDFLLVVDFGYLIPSWLLKLPKHGPLNVHPSALPKWRGSSPGHFSLLFGDHESAVTLMMIDEGLDTGPIIDQLSFTVQPNWTQTEYYNQSFELISQQLPRLITEFAEGTQKASPQPPSSPTPLARRLSREDGFITWTLLKRLLVEEKNPLSSAAQTDLGQIGSTSPLLKEVAQHYDSWSEALEHAVRAFFPWPKVWTIVPTAKGEKRMQILSMKVDQGQIRLENVKMEGENTAEWLQVRNSIAREMT